MKAWIMSKLHSVALKVGAWVDHKPRRGCLLAILFCVAFWGVLTLFATRAFAGEAELTWSTPYTYCDDTPMGTPSNIRVIWSRMDSGHAMLPGMATVHNITGLPPGEWWFAATAIVPGEGTSPKPDESQIAGPVFKTIAPEEFKTTSATVYTVVKRTDRFVLLAVGTAPVGTQCIADQTINGHYAIPRAKVTWSGSVRPDIVVAQCG